MCIHLPALLCLTIRGRYREERGGGGGTEMSVQATHYVWCADSGKLLLASQEGSVRLHVCFSDICMCVFVCPLQERGGRKKHTTLSVSVTGWLMKHSTHHAASVIYQENENPFPAPSPITHCSQLPAFLPARLYEWGWFSHKNKASNKVIINIYFHYVPCNIVGKFSKLN